MLSNQRFRKRGFRKSLFVYLVAFCVVDVPVLVVAVFSKQTSTFQDYYLLYC